MVERWKNLLTILGIEKDADLAKVLIDRYDLPCFVAPLRLHQHHWGVHYFCGRNLLLHKRVMHYGSSISNREDASASLTKYNIDKRAQRALGRSTENCILKTYFLTPCLTYATHQNHFNNFGRGPPRDHSC